MKKVTILVYSVFLILFLGSCVRTSISKNNFDRIQTGMSFKEVVQILGEPTSSSTLNVGEVIVTSANWENSHAVISIQFFNDKVKLRKFVEGVTKSRES